MSRKRLAVAPGDDCSTMRRALDDESASIAVLLDLIAVDGEFICDTLSVVGLESVGGLREVGVGCCDRSWIWLVARSLRGDSARRAGGE